jgi:hypothetical protein
VPNDTIRRARLFISWKVREALNGVTQFAPAKLVISVNVLLGRDVLSLSPEQRDRLMAAVDLSGAQWLRPQCLALSMIGKRRKRGNFISFARTQRLARLDEHPTSAFIREILVDKRDCTQTALYREAMTPGSRVRRQASSEGVKDRVSLASDGEIQAYYNRCRLLAESISERGVLPMSSEEGAMLRATDGDEGDILVAITESGEIIHYRRGRHRLAIAKALGIARVPVRIHFMSGDYLLRFMKRREVLIPGRLERAIRAAARSALAKAE